MQQGLDGEGSLRAVPTLHSLPPVAIEAGKSYRMKYGPLLHGKRPLSHRRLKGRRLSPTILLPQKAPDIMDTLLRPLNLVRISD